MLTFRWWTGRRILYIKKNLIVKYPQLVDNDNDNDNDNENNFIVMKLHFHSLYKSNSIPNKDYFSLAKKT